MPAELWPGYAAWREKVDQQLEAFRSLPRAPGRSLLNQDGRLDQDAVDLYYEEPEPELSVEKLLERKKVSV